MDEQLKQWIRLGREAFARNDFPEAQTLFERVLEQSPRAADVLNMLGMTHHAEGRIEPALECFRKAVTVNPAYTEAALNLAVTHNDLGQYEEAREVYDQARRAAQNGGGPRASHEFVKGRLANQHADLAQAYLDAEMPGEAIHELRKALLLCPDFADLRLRLANLHRDAGDLAAAASELHQALRDRPLYLPARIALGVVQFAMGDVQQARDNWLSALEVEPDNRAAQMYLRLVAYPPPSSPPPPQD